jgi:undecaprenyl-diphosphatase
VTHLTYAEAIVVGFIQGVTELFPVSSLGHNVLIPALVGGSWATDLSVAKPESPYLAFIVGLHVATAIAMIIYFWRDWVRIIGGFFTSLRDRRAVTPDQRLAWMIIFATIPVGLTGVLLEHTFRVLFAKPTAAATLLFINGLILLGAEALRRSARRRKPAVAQAAAGRPAQAFAPAGTAETAAAGAPGQTLAQGYPGARRYDSPGAPGDPARGAVGPDGARRPGSHRKQGGGRDVADVDAAEQSDARLARLSYTDGSLIGATQILALLAGISRSGVTMAGGLWRGLDHEDAARFAFLLATPIILAAGVYKIPSLFGAAGQHIHGQVVVGVIVCGIAAYLSVRFLVRWFQTRTLTPFAIYCLIFGGISIIHFV